MREQQKKMQMHSTKQNARLAALGIKIDEKGMMHRIYLFFNRHRAGFIIMLLVIINLSIWGIYQLNIESAFLEYFPKNSEIREGVSYIDSHYVGSTGFSLVIDGKKKGALCDPEILKQMDGLSGFLTDNYADIGTILSFSDFIKRLNQVMHKDMQTEYSATAESADKGSQSGESFFSDAGSFFADSDTEQGSRIPAESSPDSLAVQTVSRAADTSPSFAARYRGKALTADDVMLHSPNL